MASEDEEFKTRNGIEASDLASLLCRFEEATSSVIDVNVHVQMTSRDKLIKASTSRIEQDLTLTPPVLTQSSTANAKRKGDNILHSFSHLIFKSTSADSEFIDSPQCQIESIDVATPLSTLNRESESAPFKIIDESETDVISQLKVENVDNLSTKTFTQSGNYSTDTLGNLSLMNTLGLQEVVSQCNTLTSGSLQQYTPSATLAESAVRSVVSTSPLEKYQQNPILSTVCAIPESSNKLMKSSILQQNPTFSKSTSTSGNISNPCCQHDSSVLDDSSMGLQSPFNSGNHSFHQSTTESFSYNIDNSDIFSGSDHNYCSKYVQNFSDIHTSECENGASINTQYQDKAHKNLTDLLSEYSVESKSKCTDDLIHEECEMFIDSDGNELYCNRESQLSDIVKNYYSTNSTEAAIRIAENKNSRKRLHSWLQHTEFNNGSVNEDTCVFFDKIPSYYTALSIPSKPVTTTVFASTTKAIGSTDHLDFLDASELIDEGHYDKVPAHRRCFTNTTREVEIKLESLEEHDSLNNIMATHYSSHENNLCFPINSVQGDIGNLAATDVKQTSRSHSPYSGRRSRSVTRRSVSRFSRRSASSVSNCSTCSLCSNSSGCSTCSGVSRSPSLSDSERGSSLCSDYRRTRSRSQSSSRGSRKPAKRARHHFTPLKRQSRSRTISPSEDSAWSLKQHNYRSRKDSAVTEKRKIKEEEQVKAMEERRVVYVGKIPNGYTKRQLYQRFQSFGEIKEVKVNFREHGDNYGFVTFAYACDAVAAKEKGNSNQGEVKFDLCFGGRRHFCPDQYSDLDGNREIEEEYAPMSRNSTQELDYTALLKLHSTNQKKK